MDIPIRLVALTAALVPPVLLAVYFATGARQRIVNEPLWEAFGIGCCAAFPVLLFVSLLVPDPDPAGGWVVQAFHNAFLCAAIPEEAFKLAAVIFLTVRYGREIGYRGLFSLSVAVALGFACLENVFYVFEDDGERFSIAFLRSVSAVPGHAFAGAIMGYCLVRALSGRRTMAWYAAALIVPAGLHGGYNFFLFAMPGEIVSGQNWEGWTPYLLLIGFDLVVLLEGVLAHLGLAAIGRMVVQAGTYDAVRLPESVLERRINAAARSPGLWRVMAGLCLVGAALLAADQISIRFSSNPPAELQFAFRLCILTFLVMHGVAFLVMSRHARGAPDIGGDSDSRQR